eukprot:CAMPEP_0183744408 /NCGR_PEP_ID=MMETSP0737-20130205/65714_1 /TAXON_ID=385413 /ORGANISM="Thalassiosira miniscula, Strain CCMP1093" /LENGTH=400 /DNA_ID=CAMNT_0025980049 /DNA_START=94 /DNA_END=1292 /DNA_ORIENTATION=+
MAIIPGAILPGGGGGKGKTMMMKTTRTTSLFVDDQPPKEPIRVCLRLRPMNKLEQSHRSTNCVASVEKAVSSVTGSNSGESNNENTNKSSYASVVESSGADSAATTTAAPDSIKIESPLEGTSNFLFDRVFREDATQRSVYEQFVAPLAVQAAGGVDSAATTTAAPDSIKIESPLEGTSNFLFDRVFREDATQRSVYEQFVAPLAVQALEGFSCALLAYGQTGSGKTYTMMGETDSSTTSSATTKSKKSTTSPATGSIMEDNNDNKMGMIHRLTKDIFRLMKQSPPSVEYIVRCSFVEIYLEKVLDLLNPVNRSIQILSNENDANGASGGGGAMGMGGGGAAQPSSTDNNEGGGVRLHGASEACCIDESDVISLLVRGNACRTVSSTKMNTDSSRSHAIF